MDGRGEVERFNDGDERLPEMAPEFRLESDEIPVFSLTSPDNRAELTFQLEPNSRQVAWLEFSSERSENGINSAHRLLESNEATAARESEPPALKEMYEPDPMKVNLLSNEARARGFWSDRLPPDGQADLLIPLEIVDPAPGGAFSSDVTATLQDSSSGYGEAADALRIIEEMAEQAELRPQVNAFDPPEGWIGEINQPGADSPGRSHNCVLTASATEMRWRGSPVLAAEWPGRSGVAISTAEDLVGELKETTPAEIQHIVLEAGPGTSGLVAIERVSGSGHLLNVVNDGGRVKWLDGQVGEVTDQAPGDAVKLSWVVRNREGNRI